MEGEAEAVVLLVCGLPGAGKTTLARRAERGDAAEDWRLQRLSFDELFRIDSGDDKEGEFDPVAWKRCQREMAERVRTWRTSQAQAQEQSPSASRKQRLVLLVDDNFQYRSLRKRFAHLAADVDCGFGVLHVNTPLELCRERNAARTRVDRVPDAVFERMANAFEDPDSKQNPFERNTNALSLAETPDASVVSGVIAELVQNATQILHEKRKVAELGGKGKLQRAQDQMRTQKDVVHRVDLQLRKWISSELQQQHPGGATPKDAKKSKAELAQRLNQSRKVFLAQLKLQLRGDEATDGSDNDSVDVDAAVAVHVERFKDQRWTLSSRQKQL